MASRLELQSELEKILGSKNVYFQPPASVTISYPCIVYSLGAGDVTFADNVLYTFAKSYEMIFIYKSSNVEIIETILRKFPMCRFNNHYVSDNLNHYSFTLYY